MSIDLKKAEEDFEDFLMIMDDQLDWLDLEAEKFGIDLDYSIESLSELEKLFELTIEERNRKTLEKGSLQHYEMYFLQYVKLIDLELY